MYNLMINKVSGNHKGLLSDLKSVLNQNNFIVDKYGYIEGSTTERGKELLVHRGDCYLSFQATRYLNTNPSSINLGELDIPSSTSTNQQTGSFTCFANTSYDSLQNYGHQFQGVIANNLLHCAAPIPYEDKFGYSIYVSDDGWDYIVKTNVNNRNFFVVFGSASKGGLLFDFGTYTIGNYYIQTENIDINYPFDSTNKAGNEFFNFLQEQPNTFDGNIIFKNDIGNIRNGGTISNFEVLDNIRTTSSSYSNGIPLFGEQQAISLSQEFQNAQNFNFYEIYCLYDTTNNKYRRLKKFDFGFFSIKEINNETKIINGEAYDFYCFLEKQEDNFDLDGAQGITGIFIRRNL